MEHLSKLQKELLQKVNQKDDYDALADEILRLRDQRRQAEVDSVIKDEQMKQIRDRQDYLKSQLATITEFDETLVSSLIEKSQYSRITSPWTSNPESQSISKHKARLPYYR